jgi:hypothetical protein
LPICATWISADYGCIVCIGLLMFFDCPTAFRFLLRLQSQVRPGGIAVNSVLVEGTTYIDIRPSGHYLLRSEMFDRFRGGASSFRILKYPKHAQAVSTVVARKPGRCCRSSGRLDDGVFEWRVRPMPTIQISSPTVCDAAAAVRLAAQFQALRPSARPDAIMVSDQFRLGAMHQKNLLLVNHDALRACS